MTEKTPLTELCCPLVLSVRTTIDANGRLVVHLIDEIGVAGCAGSPFATLSITARNIPLGPNEFVFDASPGIGEQLLELMVDAGLIELTGRVADVGLETAQPICRLLKR